ncbi:MAG: flagellar basal body-associated FliL family protein [Phycisphaerae bacterium]|nr:flagellar basal body-associated FliL family protein [Gemmatimonadaceae bacterium]
MSDAPTPAETEAEAPSGPKSKLPMIAAIVVGLAVGAGSGAVVLGPIVAKKLGVSAPAVTDSAAAQAEAEAGEPAKEGEAGAKGEAAAPPVLLLENLVLNPASSGGSRYLLMSIAIESTDDASKKALEVRDAELKDLILTTLSQKTVEQLSDVGGRDAIKAELIVAVMERFGKKSIKHLYFPQFVIQ